MGTIKTTTVILLHCTDVFFFCYVFQRFRLGNEFQSYKPFQRLPTVHVIGFKLLCIVIIDYKHRTYVYVFL